MRCNRSHSARSFWSSLLVFAATFSAGIVATWYVAGPDLWNSRTIFGEVQLADPSNVEISYAGWYDDLSMRPHAEFIIYNGSDEWLGYDAEPFTFVFVDPDTRIPVGHCGIDMEGDTPPHTARRAFLFPGGCSGFRDYPGNVKVTIAIPLTPYSKKSFQRFYSEPFYLPDEIKVVTKY